MRKIVIVRIALFVILLIILTTVIHVLLGSHLGTIYVMAGVFSSTFLFLLLGGVLVYDYKMKTLSEAQLKRVFDATAEAIYGVDRLGRCTFVNKNCLHILGYESESDLLGQQMHELIHHSHQDGTPYDKESCPLVKALQEGQAVHSREEVFWKADGSCFFVEYRSNPLLFRGKTTGAVISFLDISEKKKTEERIRFLTFHDPVTKLYNQTYLFEELKRLDVQRNLPFSVMVGDVNGLKLTNDIFGHEAGDQLLIRISHVLKKFCRADDIISRSGGDEFVILLPKTFAEDAKKIRQRILAEVEKNDHSGVLGSIAFGLSTKTRNDEDLYTVMKEAEEQMYRSKALQQETIHAQQLAHIVQRFQTKSVREKIHAENVSKLCHKLSVQLNLDSDMAQRAKEAGFYHDIGKIALADDILDHHGQLNDEEHQAMRKHVITSHRILNLFSMTMDIAKAALDHHEHWDGSGYPKGRKGKEISLLGRIVAVAEAYDHYTNPQGHARMDAKAAIKAIKKDAGSRYDPQIVAALEQIID